MLEQIAVDVAYKVQASQRLIGSDTRLASDQNVHKNDRMWFSLVHRSTFVSLGATKESWHSVVQITAVRRVERSM